MIRLDNVKVSFKDKVAVDLGRVIEINDGDKIGIIGSNGAGKTTLLKSILGLLPYEGSIQMDTRAQDIAAHMQYNDFVETVPIYVIMEMVLGKKLDVSPLAMEMVKFFQFEDCLKKKWKHLSGGQKQKMTLILVMCQERQVTLFDEVTSGLDFETRQNLMRKLVEWYGKRKTTLLITSHYYEELDELVDKILLLEDGRVVDFGYKDQLFAKYCGNAVVILDDDERCRTALAEYKFIDAASGKIAISCNSAEEEAQVTEKLSRMNINYRRSNNDIEVMTINAKTLWRKAQAIELAGEKEAI